MGNEIILKTEGYKITFVLEKQRELTDSVLATLRFVLHPQLGKVEVTSMPVPIRITDLEDLASYLEEHISKLQHDKWSQSDVFLTYDLNYQLQAFAGDVDSLEDGEFTLLFLVNAGRPDEESARVYVGGEAVVTLEQVHEFTTWLRRVLRELV